MTIVARKAKISDALWTISVAGAGDSAKLADKTAREFTFKRNRSLCEANTTPIINLIFHLAPSLSRPQARIHLAYQWSGIPTKDFMLNSGGDS